MGAREALCLLDVEYSALYVRADARHILAGKGQILPPGIVLSVELEISEVEIDWSSKLSPVSKSRLGTALREGCSEL